MKNSTSKRLKNQFGNWALITGSTSGIGHELALQLASAGFNLIITGRSERKLNTLSTDLLDKHKIEVLPITGDLSHKTEVDYLVEETEHLPIQIAILNAGFGTSGKFLTSNIEEELNLVDVNCKAVLQLCYHFGNRMSYRGNGAIVLLSSIVAFQGVPNAANYAASKAYIQSFAEAIAIELKPKGVKVLSAAPGPVNTGFAYRADMEMGNAQNPKMIAEQIIKNLLSGWTNQNPRLQLKNASSIWKNHDHGKCNGWIYEASSE